MAPIKFEEQLKDKLNKRSLSPSRDGWSKLAQRLDEEENRSKKSMYWWLSIAAGLLIMLAVSVQFFNKNETEKMMNTVVEDKVHDTQLDFSNSNKENQESTQLASKNETQYLKQKNVIKSSAVKAHNTLGSSVSNVETQLIQNVKTIKIINTKKTQQVAENAMLENTVVTTLKEMKLGNDLHLSKEVDSLLKLASKALLSDGLKNTVKTVDANALLLSVEEDMGQSFRSKVYEALEGSYKTLKTRVVDRKN